MEKYSMSKEVLKPFRKKKLPMTAIIQAMGGKSAPNLKDFIKERAEISKVRGSTNSITVRKV